ncbi:MAG: DHA2 family efflux MFS transporter permease subunit [Mycobacterium sp.]
MFVSHTSTARPTAGPLDPALVKLALAVLVGVIAAILDLTIVNVAIDTLQRQLHAGVAMIQWVSTGYALAVALTIPVSGWLFERLGARRAWLLALTIFLAGSTLCAAAWSIASLIAFRVLQGVGGGLLLPLAQTILVTAAGRERLARVVPYIAIPSQLGPVLGPVLGGAILSNASWRFIFLINVPFVVLALVLGWRTVPSTVTAQTRRLDVLGWILLSPALALLVFGFSQAGVTGGFDRAGVIGPLVAGLVLLVGYCVHALRSRAEPPLNLRYLRVRGYATSSALMFASGITLFGALFLLPLYYQQVRGASALAAGLLLAPQGVGVAIGTIVGGRLIERFQLGYRMPALIGMALLTVATVPYVFAGPSTGELFLGVVVGLRGIGLGLALVPVMTALYVGLPPEAIPSATTGVRIFQQVGGALGTAVLAVILTHSQSFQVTFAWVLGLTVLSFVPALLLPGKEQP